MIDVTQLTEERPPRLGPGDVAILNVGQGDMRVSFNSDDPADVERARLVVKDMLEHGYQLFVETEAGLVRVDSFDPTTDEYVIKIDRRSKRWRDADRSAGKKKAGKKKSGKKKTREKRVSAKNTKSTAVAPTGGG